MGAHQEIIIKKQTPAVKYEYTFDGLKWLNVNNNDNIPTLMYLGFWIRRKNKGTT